jgi:putative ABC transport system ATP-binding protein
MPGAERLTLAQWERTMSDRSSSASSSVPPAVEARALTKRIHDGRERRVVLEGIDLVVERGELVLLRGPSGSGKTTLLALLGAMLSPTSGEVLLDGEPTSRLRDRHRAEVRRRRVGFVFQDVQLIEGMSVVDNTLLARVPDGISAADRARARSLLDRFGVGRLASVAARGLSGGERQRVALARALLGDPALLLLDEPTAHLDAERADDLVALLIDLVTEGRALVIATHDDRFAGELVRAGSTRARVRTVLLAAGRLAGHGEGEPAS